jgi:hypothetical protein
MSDGELQGQLPIQIDFFHPFLPLAVKDEIMQSGGSSKVLYSDLP